MTITYRGVKGQAITAQEYDDTILDLDTRPNGQVYPKAKEIGIKVDNAAPDFGWHDLTGDIFYDPSSPNTPSYQPYIGSIKERQYDVGDEGFLTLHLPHDYAMGTDLFIHVHWSHNSLTVEGGAPTFAIEGTYAKGHNQAAFGPPVAVTLSEPASTTRYQHMITEVQFSNVGGTGGLLNTNDIEVDGLLLLRVALIGNTMTDGVLPFVHFVDVHYQSTGLATKQKSPDFWT